MRLPFSSLVLLSLICLSAASFVPYSSDVDQPLPRRPERFGKDDQYSNYLKELQDYYGVHGRGRYGKRQMRTIMSDVYVRDDLPPPPPPPPFLLYPAYNVQYHRALQRYYGFNN